MSVVPSSNWTNEFHKQKRAEMERRIQDRMGPVKGIEDYPWEKLRKLHEFYFPSPSPQLYFNCLDFT